METQIHICFNPNCTSLSNQRVFIPSQDSASIEHAQKCHHWIATPRQQLKIINQGLSFYQSKPEEDLNLDSYPIESVIEFSQRKVVMRDALMAIFESVKKELCSFIDSYKVMKLRALEGVNRDVEMLKKMVTSTVEELHKNRLLNQAVFEQVGEFVDHQWSKYPMKGLFLNDIHLFSKDKIVDQLPDLKHKLAEIFDSLISQKRIEGSLQTVKLRHIKQAESFLLANSEVSSQQKLMRLCNYEITEFLSGNAQSSQVKCPQCTFEQKFPANRNTGNPNYYAQALAQHLAAVHRPFIGYCYAQRISHDPPEKMTLETVLYLMQSQNYKQLEIIDGINVKAFTLDLCPTKLNITFSPSNPSQHQRQCSWMEVSNPEEAAYFTILLMHEVAIKMKKVLKIIGFKKQYHALFSKLVISYELENRFIIEDKVRLLRHPPPKSQPLLQVKF